MVRNDKQQLNVKYFHSYRLLFVLLLSVISTNVLGIDVYVSTVENPNRVDYEFSGVATGEKSQVQFDIVYNRFSFSGFQATITSLSLETLYTDAYSIVSQNCFGATAIRTSSNVSRSWCSFTVEYAPTTTGELTESLYDLSFVNLTFDESPYSCCYTESVTETIVRLSAEQPEPAQPGFISLPLSSLEYLEGGDDGDGVGAVTLDVERYGGASGNSSVRIEFEALTATAGQDYLRGADGNDFTAVFRWNDGESGAKPLRFSIPLDDVANEDTETFRITLSNPVNSELGDITTTTVFILDKTIPRPGLVSFSETSYTVREDESSLSIPIERTGGDDGPASVTYAVTAQEAVAGEDFTVSGGLTGTLTWPDGDSDQRFIVIEDLIDDEYNESDESLYISLIDSSGAFLGDLIDATVSIVDTTVPPLPGMVAFEDSETTVSENVDGGLVDIVLVRSGGDAGELSVSLDYEELSATTNVDFEILTNSVTWLAGESGSKVIQVGVISDDIAEATESFEIVLSANDPSWIGEPSITKVDITDVTPLVGQVAFANTEIIVSENIDGNVVDIVLVRSGGDAGELSVNLDYVALEATPNDDFEVFTNSVTWAADESGPKVIQVEIHSDDIAEPTESFEIVLSAVDPSWIGEPSITRVDITDVPPLIGQVAFANTETTVSENVDGNVVDIVLVRSGGEAGALSVNLDYVGLEATTNADFEILTNSVTWAADESGPKVIQVGINSDDITEPTESFEIALSASDPLWIGEPSTTRVNITDVPPPIGQVAFTVDLVEVNESEGLVTVSVSRSGGRAGEVSVIASTVPGSALPGDDYETVSTTISWLDQEIGSKEFEIPLTVDEVGEDAEEFSVVLEPVQPINENTLLAEPRALTVRILAHATTLFDGGEIRIVSENVNLLERGSDGLAGTTTVVVERIPNDEGAATGEVSIGYELVSGTAIVGEDVVIAEGRLSWLDGESGTREIVLSAIPDTEREQTEQAVFRLLDQSAPSNIILQTGRASVPVEVQDSAFAEIGQLVFASESIDVFETAGTVEVTVSRQNGTLGAASVTISSVSGTAEQNVDFIPIEERLLWADGEGGDKTISIVVLDDDIEEGAEEFKLVLVDAEPYGDDQQLGARREQTVRIAERAQPEEAGEIQFVGVDRSIPEPGTSTIVVERINGADGPVEAELFVQSESTASSADYRLSTTVLRWEDGESGRKEVDFEALADSENEGREVLVLQIAIVEGAAELGTPSEVEIVIESIQSDTEFSIESLTGTDLLLEEGVDSDSLTLSITNATGQPAVGEMVYWNLLPVDASQQVVGEILGGRETLTDATGQVSNQVRIDDNGLYWLVGRVGTPFLSPQSSLRSFTRSRNNIIDPAPYDLAPNEFAFLLRVGLEALENLSTNQRSAAAGLDDACDAIELQNSADLEEEQLNLLATCQEIENSADPAQLLDRVAAEEIFALGDAAIDTADIQVTNVYSRLNAIRAGRSDLFDVSNLSFNLWGERIPGNVVEVSQDALYNFARENGSGASADDLLSGSRLGFFASGQISVGTVDGDGRQRDADLSTNGLTFGADYRLSNSLVFGAGLSFLSNTTDFANGEGGTESRGTGLSLFGTWYEPGEGYIDIVLDIGRNDYDTKRQINLPENLAEFGLGSTSANVFSLTASAARNFSYKAFELSFASRASIKKASIDGFTESSSSEINQSGTILNIDNHETTSIRLAISIDLSRAISLKRAVVIPQIKYEIEQESEYDKGSISASFVHDDLSTPIEYFGLERDRVHANIGLGGSAVFAGGRSAFLFYETRTQHDNISQYWVKTGFRWEF